MRWYDLRRSALRSRSLGHEVHRLIFILRCSQSLQANPDCPPKLTSSWSFAVRSCDSRRSVSRHSRDCQPYSSAGLRLCDLPPQLTPGADPALPDFRPVSAADAYWTGLSPALQRQFTRLSARFVFQLRKPRAVRPPAAEYAQPLSYADNASLSTVTPRQLALVKPTC